jgi:outer membrane protein assembly factor BamA
MFKFIRNYLLIQLLLFAFLNPKAIAQTDSLKWSIKPTVGFQQSNFDWSIAGNAAGTSPNILSELIWQDVKGLGFGLDVGYKIIKNLTIKTSSQYYTISSAEATDTDYADDNRESAFYHDVLNAGKGHLFKTNLQLSYQILRIDQLSINPTIGAAYRQHEFYLLESLSNPNTAGLKSTYKTAYTGIDLGTEFIFSTKSFEIGVEVLAGFYKYSAKANWNLIPDFEKPVSFIHKANSFSLAGNLNLAVPLNQSLKLELNYKMNRINTHSGVDRAFYVNQPAEETLFNGATFNTNALLLGLNFNF